MTDEQVWDDLSRFALAMKRGATVVFNNGQRRPGHLASGVNIDFEFSRDFGGIREIIEPPKKKVRPLNADEWRDVAGCVICPLPPVGAVCIIAYGHNPEDAKYFADQRATCHPPGNSKDVRKLWVEE